MVATVSDTTATETFIVDNLPLIVIPVDPNPPDPVKVKVNNDATGATSCEGDTETTADNTERRVAEEFVDRNLRPNITNSISSGPSLGTRTIASSKPVEMVATIRISRVSTANEWPFKDAPILAADMSPPTAPNPKPAMVTLTTPDVVANTSDGLTEENGVAQSNDDEIPVLCVKVPLGHAMHDKEDAAFSEEDHVLNGQRFG